MNKRHILNSKEWLDQLREKRGDKDITPVVLAIDYYSDASSPLLAKGLAIADILLALGLDNETLGTAIIYPGFEKQYISVDTISEKFGEACRKMLSDVLQMRLLGRLQHLRERPQQIENLRKMFLAMVSDVRAVLMILAERLWQLRNAKDVNKQEQLELAQETIGVYAPLANRLGVWQLKWEMEDLCLRYLQPEVYKMIAKGIAKRRVEREEYIQRMILLFNNLLQQAGIKHFQVTGRVKHIYSIYHKMQRKNADLAEIYDKSALRVLVEKIEDCYTVLSLLNEWQQIPEEFDDYIAHPKPNGYRSIHTVLIGPENHIIEVQIRTKQMHQESELGVAAHWRYKEGVLQAGDYEAKIALLRQIIAWQKEVAQSDEEQTGQSAQDLFADQVYVFTPLGDIIDLPKGATPVDFAYYIHSEVGHRCRGAKVNGEIVPLTYHLQTGERVEILTAKIGEPSRDWINPHLGYINTSRARAKAQHWFRLKDSTQTGALLRQPIEKESKKIIPTSEIRPIKPETFSNIMILGVNNLLTHIALCCKPLPGDAVIGYITRHRGVSVHRKDCSNISPASQAKNERVIEVEWGNKQHGSYQADLLLKMHDTKTLSREISTLLGSEKINVIGLQIQKINDSSIVDVYLTIEIIDKEQLQKALHLLQQIPNLIEVKRR